MSWLQIILLAMCIVIQIPNAIIDFRHRKREGYDRANPAVYYSRLSKEGSWEGKYMIASVYIGIYCILILCGFMFYELSR